MDFFSAHSLQSQFNKYKTRFRPHRAVHNPVPPLNRSQIVNSGVNTTRNLVQSRAHPR